VARLVAWLGSAVTYQCHAMRGQGMEAHACVGIMWPIGQISAWNVQAFRCSDCYRIGWDC
jgi:hypothetical protein